MKKLIKKVIVGAFVALFALQTVTVSQAHAAQDIVFCTITTSRTDASIPEIDVDGASTYSSYTRLPIKGVSMSANGSKVALGTYYDLSDHAYDLSEVSGEQDWVFKLTPIKAGSNLDSIELTDDLGNRIKKVDYTNVKINSRYEVIISTYIPRYDLNYDGVVNLTDANLALRMSLGTVTPSNLQIILGDTNNSKTIDSADADYILKVALNLVQ